MNPLVQRLMDRAAGEALEIVRFFGGVIAVWLVLVTFIFAAFHIPSGSMKPSLEVGDRVLVSKWAYGYSRHSLPLGIGYLLPSSWNGRIAWADPQRGDVVVFRDERQRDGRPRNLIKRVIGVAGDTIEVRDGRLYINGEAAPRVLEEVRTFRNGRNGPLRTVTAYSQVLPGDIEFDIYEISDNHPAPGWSPDDYGPVTVLPGTVFVMGDNRDASNDSRAPDGPGLVPLANVVGRAETVMFTMASCRREADLYCPTGRVWRGL